MEIKLKLFISRIIEKKLNELEKSDIPNDIKALEIYDAVSEEITKRITSK